MMKAGVQRKRVKQYPLNGPRGGATVSILECGHAVAIRNSDAKTKRHVCGFCTKAETTKAAAPVTKKALQQVISKFGLDEVLKALAERERKASALKKAREKRWPKAVPSESSTQAEQAA